MATGASEGRFSKGIPVTLRFTLTSQDGITVEHDQPVIIAVGHDQGAHQPGGNTPGSGPDIIPSTIPGIELNIECFGKILTEEMGGPGLKGLAVLHHGLDGEGLLGAGEALVRGLDAADTEAEPREVLAVPWSGWPSTPRREEEEPGALLVGMPERTTVRILE